MRHLRQVSVKRGLDVRDFMLTTFGGSGSLLACRLVDILDLAGVVVPPNPGNVSAFGLLTVDVKNDYVQTAVARHDVLDLATVQHTFDELTARAAAALDAEGFPREAHRYVRSVDLRYFGQAFEVRVPAPAGDVTDAYATAVSGAFHDAHRALYGYDFRDDPRQQVEWVNLRVTGTGPITRPELREVASADGAPPVVERARTGTRPVCFDTADGYVDTDVYWRSDLFAGDVLHGPAIVEEFGSTVPVHPGFAVRVDAWGNLVMTRSAAAADTKGA
jgi:N-methylhydantoinase A